MPLGFQWPDSSTQADETASEGMGSQACRGVSPGRLPCRVVLDLEAFLLTERKSKDSSSKKSMSTPEKYTNVETQSPFVRG